MNTKPQVIFDDGKPAFIVLRYEDYLSLTRQGTTIKLQGDDFVPFVLSDYINNPIRIARIEAGLNQQQLAKLLGVTQGYISRIEARDFNVKTDLQKKVKSLIAREQVLKSKNKGKKNKNG